MRWFPVVVLAVAASSALAVPPGVETYTLPNGLTVTLHVDRTLPEVRVNIWYRVGSADEAPGRTGFAHLFEHLMFMGTTRVPGSGFDVTMENGGGANNASTSQDRTNYYSWGPSSQLPTLLWLDADRMEGLGAAMTDEKLKLQRDVVRNERRQSYENAPYGQVPLVVAEALYPEGHPYHHEVIGSHADLEAATLADVKAFFAANYVPANASLVVAGDFDAKVVRELIARTFGAVPARPSPARVGVAPVSLDREVRRIVTDAVEEPRLVLVWPAPPAFAEGSAEIELLATILDDGAAGRLRTRLVIRDRLAQDLAVYVDSRRLGSELHVEVSAPAGADLERVKRTVLEELEHLKADGPTAAELAGAKAAAEAVFLHRRESLESRADLLNEYWTVYGEADAFDSDLARRVKPTAASMADVARRVLGAGRLDLRVLPKDARIDGASLDARPADLPAPAPRALAPERLTLANGVPLLVLPRPGSGVFSGTLVVDGGERYAVPAQAGLAKLTATLLTRGAGSRDATAFGAALAAAGARLDAAASWYDTRVVVSGLTSRLGATLDLFADVVVRPRLDEADFIREKEIQLANIATRGEVAADAAHTVARILTFGPDDPRGRPVDGYVASVKNLGRGDAVALVKTLLDPDRATLVFAGDVAPAELKKALDERLTSWRSQQGSAPPSAPPLSGLQHGEIVLVHRPGAPQSTLLISRPTPPADLRTRVLAAGLNVLFGDCFTSRLMQNIREKHGYSYGASSNVGREAGEHYLTASTAVATEVTGPALVELRRELDSIATGNVTEEEWLRAVRTMRYEIETAGGTAASAAAAVAAQVRNGLPADELGLELAELLRATREEANAEARSGRYDWSSMLVVVVGDKDKVLPQLASAKLPPPRLVDLEGRPANP